MPEPFRLRVLKALTTAIKQVTPANDCENDLSDYTDDGGTIRPRVMRGRERYGDGDPLPMVSILEDPRALELTMPGGDARSGISDYSLVVQGFVQDDPDNPTDPAHVLAAEVVRAIARTRTRNNILGLGNKESCVSDIRVGGYVVRPADDLISTTAFFYMTITLRLVEDLENPFGVT